MGLFSFFGNGAIKKALLRGAVIIDVRSANEFDRGRIPGSINIPVDRIAANTERIKLMNRPIICCCASGQRSGIATSTLKKAGIKDVYNGSSWEKVLRIMNSL